MKRLRVFWRENKGAPFVEMRFGSRYFLQAQFFPRSPNVSERYNERWNILEMEGKKERKNNLSIDHFPPARSQSVVHFCFIPILSHYSLFSHCAASRAKRKVAGRSDHDIPAHRSFLKMVPIWVIGEKACRGTNEAPRLACSRAALSSDLDSFAVCRRGKDWMVRTALGYIS